VQTQSPKDLYRYTDKAMPDSYPEWPKGPQVHAYLTDYARDNDLVRAIRFNTAVLQMNRRPDSAPGWRLDLRGPDGGTRHEDYDFVAVCTGQFNEPQTLSLPGEESFKAQGGRILHSSQYNDPMTAKGRKIVVLGGSKSATDIAVNAVNSGAAEVTIVYREPVWRIPAAWSISNAFSTSARRRRCSGAGASARCRGSPMLSPSRWSGPIGADWRAC
jgi:cation diffusion facilitator CzcD-associated flavoprotein CzcO